MVVHTYLSNLFVLLLDELELVLHLVFQLDQEGFGNVTHCCFRKFLQGILLGFTIDLLEFFFENRCAHFKGFLEGTFELFLCLLLSSLAL